MSLQHPTEIPFTQYVAPSGRARPVFFDSDPETHKLAMELINKGFRFEAEVLSTGEVSLTVYDLKMGEDIAIEICPNGPGIEQGVSALVKQATTIAKGA